MAKLRNSQEWMVEDVEAFSKKFGLPQLENSGFLKDEDMSYRFEFIQEELDEFIESWKANDLEGGLDALVDMMYVIIGTAWLMNVPIMDAWDRVHHANMNKVRITDPNDPRSTRNHPWDVVKPDGWIAPDLKDLLK